jgi:RNA-directed DNA polymerase
MTRTLGHQATDGAEGHATPTDWSQINWRKAYRVVRNLRRRIFRAATQRHWKRLRSLTQLLLRSHSNLLLSIRQVTQVNDGKHTPGVDGEIADTPEKRAALVDHLRGYQPWKASPVRRVYIPKANGKQRPLGIPTIRDRIMQAVVKNALEPRFESEFEAKSYGFRPGRSCQDAIADIHTALSDSASGKQPWVLDADIKGAFDHINHAYVLTRIGQMPGRELVKQWLQAGYVEWGTVHETTEGSPQGGVVSPVLANIALDGLQAHLGTGYRYVRYADDLLVMAKTRSAVEQAIPRIEAWLQERGLELNQEKTRIIHRTEGVNFLGWHIRMYGKKLLTKPQKEKVLGLLRRVAGWLARHKTTPAQDVIAYLNPVLRGWAMYYRQGASKKTFDTVDYMVWRMLWRWAKRRHPNKPRKWVFDHYFQKGPYGRTFYAETTDRHGHPTRTHLVRIQQIPIRRHVKVKGTASPDDPTLTTYWEERRKRLGQIRLAKGSKLYHIASRQGWTCPHCGAPLFNGEPLDLDHKTPIQQGGGNEATNLQWLHQACHYHKHQQQSVARRQSA